MGGYTSQVMYHILQFLGGFPSHNVGFAGLLQYDDNVTGPLPYYVRPPTPANLVGDLPGPYTGADQIPIEPQGGYSYFLTHVAISIWDNFHSYTNEVYTVKEFFLNNWMNTYIPLLH